MTPTARVGDLAEQIRGVSYGKEDASKVPKPGYLPVLRAGNIGDDGLVFNDLVFIPAARVSTKQKVRKGDVVIAASSGSLDVVGKAARARADYDGGFGAFCKVLRPSSLVDPTYFAHFFRTREYRRRVSGLASGANINNLRNEHLDEMLIPVPPLPEQRRIADILDKADALRAKRRAALKKLDELTQSIFLDMFGDPATNPSGWRVATLRSLGQVITGTTPPSARAGMFDGPVPFVTPGDLESGQPVKRTVTEEGAALSRTVNAGATLVCCIGATIGKMGNVPIRSAFNQQINAVQWDRDVEPHYGLACLRFFKPKIIAWGASTTLPILKKSSFEQIEIPVPPYGQQGAFARLVEKVRQLESNHKSSLHGAETLFASLQHRAFRGEL